MNFSKLSSYVKGRGKGYIVKGARVFWKGYKAYETNGSVDGIGKGLYVISSGLFWDYGSAFLFRNKGADKDGLPISAIVGGIVFALEYRNDPRFYEALGLDLNNPSDQELMLELMMVLEAHIIGNPELFGLAGDSLLIKLLTDLQLTKEVLCYLGETAYALAAEDGYDAAQVGFDRWLERQSARTFDTSWVLSHPNEPPIAMLSPSIIFAQAPNQLNVTQKKDPLVLNLGSWWPETVSVDKGILFDHDGDGIKHGSGWLAPRDGFLVMDRNGDGIINDGSELFGDNTEKYWTLGGKCANAFDALA